MAGLKAQPPGPPQGYGEGCAAVEVHFVLHLAAALSGRGRRARSGLPPFVKLRRDSPNCGTLAAARVPIGLSALARLHHCGSLRPMSAILAKLASQEAGLSCLYVLSRG